MGESISDYKNLKVSHDLLTKEKEEMGMVVMIILEDVLEDICCSIYPFHEA